jgi:two-component system, LytTR family, response regulator
MQMKIYILEYGLHIMHRILQMLQRSNHFQIVGHAVEIAKASTEISALKPDIILVDTDLKDGNSFDLFDEVDVEDYQVIFLSTHDKYARQALNMGVFGYLLKPIDDVELGNLLGRCYRNWERRGYGSQQIAPTQHHPPIQNIGNNKRIALKNSVYIELVNVQDIMYCKSDKGYTTFYLKNKTEILVSQGLKNYENTLKLLGFIRCHQSYLINLKYVKKYYREGFFQMNNEEKIPVSSRKKEDVLRYLQNII